VEAQLRYLLRAIELGREAAAAGGGPFGAVVVRGDQVVGEGRNESLPRSDPTAHAELLAIRAAGAALGRRDLSDCVLYSSAEPCPMCLAACYWASIPTVIYSASSADAGRAGFEDPAILRDLLRDPELRAVRMRQLHPEAGQGLLEDWQGGRIPQQSWIR